MKKGELILSLQAYSFRHLSFFEMLAVAERLGFKYVEAYPGQRLGNGLKGTTDYKTMSWETLQVLKTRLAQSPVKVISYGVTGARGRDEWSKLMAFAVQLGIKQIQIEVGASKEVLDDAEEFARRFGVRVSLHNHRQEIGKPQHVLEALKGRSAWIGAGSDVGHWMRAGVNPLDGIKLLKGRFHTIHLVDAAEKQYGYRDIPLGSGVLDLNSILNELKDQGGTIYTTIEYEVQGPGLEAEVGACVRWFRAWERGEIGADNRLNAKGIAALWTGLASAQPLSWDTLLKGRLANELAEKTAKMKRLEVDLSSVKANKPGANPREQPPMAFSTDPHKKYCQVNWEKPSFVSCKLAKPGTPKVYTLSSSDDIHTRTPTAWGLFGSDDGQNWFLLDERKGESFTTSYTLKGYEIAKPRPCAYMKLEIRAQGGDAHMQFSRLGFYE